MKKYVWKGIFFVLGCIGALPYLGMIGSGIMLAVGIWNVIFKSNHSEWPTIVIALAGVLAFGLFTLGIGFLAGRAEEKVEKYEELERQRKEEKEKKELEELLARLEAEEQARLDAMTPEERRRYEEEQRRKREAEREAAAQPLVLGAEDYARISARASSIMSGESGGGYNHALHDELDAAAKAQRITETYGDDWKGYDPEAPGPDPD